MPSKGNRAPSLPILTGVRSRFRPSTSTRCTWSPMPSRSEYLLAVALGMSAVSRTDAQQATATEFSLRAIPEIRRSNDASWLDAAALGHQGAITVDAELRLQSRGVTAVGTLLGRD